MSHNTPLSTSSRHPSESSNTPQTRSTAAFSKSLPRAASSRRRDKPQLSCNQCRRRKSKCDRQRPCSCCSARDQLCTYPETPATLGPSGSLPAAFSTHDRIVQLERLVMSMMPDPAGRSNVGPAPEVNVHLAPGTATPADTVSTETPIDALSECGSMRINDSELHCWRGSLGSDIGCCGSSRVPMAPTGDERGNGNTAFIAKPQSGGAFVLYGCRRPASLDKILSALPPKPAVDRYISRYLQLLRSSAAHGPSILREYDAFWVNPSSVPVIWVGLLFGMICLACLASDPPEGLEAEQQSLQVDLYREKVVQCLVMGQYTKGGPYVLETVINYVYVEFCSHRDADMDLWFLLALEVNLARRMGYHRDPSHFPSISPFQGEMRRRLWATVLMSDILISNQMGMPRTISDWQYDTKEPRNLNDHNFDKDTTELPLSRPETELTTALGIIAQTRMLKALGVVADLTSAVKPCHYTEALRVDGILHEAAETITPLLKMKPMAASLTDTPQVIVARLFIQHMLYKGQIMLHRRFICMQAPSRDKDIYAYSRTTCLNASLGTLEIQHVFDEETRPGGQLHAMRWRITSVMNNLFLTATMLLCSLVYRGQAVEREDDIRAALQRARTIWMRRSSISKEAKKAAETVSLVLSRAAKGQSGGTQKENDHGLGFDVPTNATTPDGWMTFVNWPESI
ncbi:fungal-specific transcription factor domain-containing protein [Aspergillus aurantiobrunneus]